MNQLHAYNNLCFLSVVTTRHNFINKYLDRDHRTFKICVWKLVFNTKFSLRESSSHFMIKDEWWRVSQILLVNKITKKDMKNGIWWAYVFLYCKIKHVRLVWNMECYTIFFELSRELTIRHSGNFYWSDNPIWISLEWWRRLVEQLIFYSLWSFFFKILDHWLQF